MERTAHGSASCNMQNGLDTTHPYIQIWSALLTVLPHVTCKMVWTQHILISKYGAHCSQFCLM
ncbi:hypothetical protein DPMN_174077 [Dreissena polymorpha]|uniref:Uncharacterized protein n=1 Tax=Dreissena polymorpha TaxID=45954 RepID=A0A9D4E439_DREPO|nr:hypothetical protein DPMN_174077 [Dreissena polymorpha]